MPFSAMLRRGPFTIAGIALLVALVLVAGIAPLACPAGPLARVAPALQTPSLVLLAGSDNIGRSVLCLTFFGLRTSLVIGIASGVLALILGIGIGTLAGIAGGWTDLLLMRLTEVMLSIPRLFLAILVAALFEPNVTGLVLVLGITSWGMLARIARAEAMALSAREFVLAARALGLTTPRLILRHVLPNVLSPLLATGGSIVAGAILAEAALSYVGLGDPGAVSLGRSIANAYPFMELAWWMSAAPIAALIIVTLTFMLLFEATDGR